MGTAARGVDLSALPPEIIPRVELTLSCRDTDPMPKVADAGSVTTRDGERVQVMHDGTVVVAGGYFGDWMSTIIAGLRGHHEPQEEVVFQAMLDRLEQDAPAAPVLLEPGCFWAYYSVWFARRFPQGRAFGLEPDPHNLAVGRRNADLNGVADRVCLKSGIIGGQAGEPLEFVSETTGQVHHPVQHDFPQLLAAAGTEHVDVLVCDIQGAELPLLESARPLLESGAVRFCLVSTHHHSISGDPLTHERVLDLLLEVGAHVVAEHTVEESASGDGLVAVSFDPRDVDLHVEVSRARSGTAVFDTTPLRDLARAWTERDEVRAALTASVAEADALRVQLASSPPPLQAALREALRPRTRLRALRARTAARRASGRQHPGS